MAESPLNRIMAHVTQSGNYNGTPHWLYHGALDKDGYGVVRTGSRTDGSRRMRFVHEVVAEHYKGGDNGALQWDHLCHVRNCVNPAHLVAKTQQANLANRRF